MTHPSNKSANAASGAASSVDRQLTRSVRRHLLAALLVSVLLVGGFGGFAALARISGAVVAPPPLVVESNVRRIHIRKAGSSARSPWRTATASPPATCSCASTTR